MTDQISWSQLSSYRRECYDRFGSITQLRIIQEPYQLLRQHLTPQAQILDVGAGIDAPLKQLITTQTYAALEPDPNAAADFRTIDEIPADQRFDIAWSNQVLEHVTIPDAMTLVKGVFDVLNEGGVYISTVPNVAHPVRYWGDATHLTHWPIGDYYGLFRMQGYEVIDYVRYGKVGLPANPLKRFIVTTISDAFRMDWADSLAIVAQKPRS